MNPRTRLLEAVQAMRHNPINENAIVRGIPALVPVSYWVELCEAYDEVIKDMKENL